MNHATRLDRSSAMIRFALLVLLTAATEEVSASPKNAASRKETARAEKTETDRPNIVIIFTDDQGYQELGCFGDPRIKTPHIDQLAKEGVKFTSFYSSAPACSASRVGLLTGCYARRFHIPIVLHPKSRIGLHPQELTIADLLKSRDYRTACIGKWHVGDHLETFPTRQGFDQYYGIPYSNDMPEGKKIPAIAGISDSIPFKKRTSYWTWIWETQNFKFVNTPLYENEQIVEQPVNQSLITDKYAQKAVQFIKDQKSKRPFFLYLAHNMPHVPLAAPPRLHDPNIKVARQIVIQHIDETVGKIIQAIDEIGQKENTLIIFTSDNGLQVRHAKIYNMTANLLRGGKGNTFEGGQRVPCVMRWPAKMPAGQVCSQITSTIDLLPTIAHLVDVRLPEDRPVDGVNVSALLSNPQSLSPYHDTDKKHGFLYYRNPLKRPEGIRHGKWKLRSGELYDLDADIGETKNVAKQFPKIVGHLQKMMLQQDHAIRATSRKAWRQTP